MSTLNIAHRGASAAAPANTMAAFHQAAALGADGIEFDVHLSADGVPVVIHDFTLDATTDGTGRVRDQSLAQLKRLDAGSYFGPEFAGQRIPTLEEVLDTFGGRLLLNAELKSASLHDGRLEEAVGGLTKRYELVEHVIVSSFNPLSLRRIKRVVPGIRVGLNYSSYLPLHWLAWMIPHEAKHPHHTLVNARSLASARRRGYLVNAWTVDDPAEMERLATLGVDGILTNVPDVLGTVLQSLEL